VKREEHCGGAARKRIRKPQGWPKANVGGKSSFPKVKDGAGVAFAAHPSCTNTSNPAVLGAPSRPSWPDAHSARAESEDQALGVKTLLAPVLRVGVHPIYLAEGGACEGLGALGFF